jgi:hypothetical protein
MSIARDSERKEQHVTILSIPQRAVTAQAILLTVRQVKQSSVFYRWLFIRKVWRAARSLTPVQRKMLCFIAQARGTCTPYNGYGLASLWPLQERLLIERVPGVLGGYVATPFGIHVARMCQEGTVDVP